MQPNIVLFLTLLISGIFAEDSNITEAKDVSESEGFTNETYKVQKDYIGHDYYGGDYGGEYYNNYYDDSRIFGSDFYESFHPQISYPSQLQHHYHHHTHLHEHNKGKGSFIPAFLCHITAGSWEELFKICQNNTIYETYKEALILDWAQRQGETVYVCFSPLVFT